MKEQTETIATCYCTCRSAVQFVGWPNVARTQLWL